MKYTNKQNLPIAIANAVKADTYSKGDSEISATGLISPPRLNVLKERHEQDLVEDVSDGIHSLFGQVVHTILERAIPAVRLKHALQDLLKVVEDKNDTLFSLLPQIAVEVLVPFLKGGVVILDKYLEANGYLVEKRFFAEVDGIKISGQIDIFDIKKKCVQDYKTSTIYKFKSGKPSPEFIDQININAFLLRENGYEVESGEIHGILKDWSASKALKEYDCPKKQVVTIPVTVDTQENILQFIKGRVKLFKDARVELPECTIEERWGKPDIWAVKLEGSDRAMNGGLCPSEGMAIAKCEAVAQRGKKATIEFRPGANIRCEAYCPVNLFCSQFKKLKKE